jgi:cell division protein FtsQ
MWDNPRWLNLAANVLFGVALAGALALACLALMRSPVFSLRSIRVLGQPQHVTAGDVVNALQGRVSGTFFTVDLDSVRGLFEGIPWVRRAEVRRLWPDELEVRIEEQVPLARWGRETEGQLVNAYGELFRGRSDSVLPAFAGPAASEAEVTRRYTEFRKLLAPLGVEPRSVLLSPRYAWQLRLSNGLVVQLGRERDKDAVVDRLARFVEAYPRTLGKLQRRVEYVDLRYPNGFAVRLPESHEPATHRMHRA